MTVTVIWVKIQHLMCLQLTGLLLHFTYSILLCHFILCFPKILPYWVPSLQHCTCKNKSEHTSYRHTQINYWYNNLKCCDTSQPHNSNSRYCLHALDCPLHLLPSTQPNCYRCRQWPPNSFHIATLPGTRLYQREGVIQYCLTVRLWIAKCPPTTDTMLSPQKWPLASELKPQNWR